MVWLFSAIGRGHLRSPARGALCIATVLGLCHALGGCSTGGAGQSMASFAQASSGPTLAFESIDGPPPAVFDRLVTALNAEAAGLPLTVVSRNMTAGYHIRGYLSAQVKRGRSVIAWVFDAYDGNGQRALRLSGEEAAGKPGRDAWTAADDQVLRRIAQAGMSGLSAYINGGPAVPETPAPDARGPLVASAGPISSGLLAAETGQRALGFSAY